MIVMDCLLSTLFCRRGNWRGIKCLGDVVCVWIGRCFGRGRVAELKWLEQIIELVVTVVTLHLGSSSPLVVERPSSADIRSIVPRMMFLMSIRVAELWTPSSVAALAVLAIVLLTAVILLVRRS